MLEDYLRRLAEQGRAHDADFAIGLVDFSPQTEQFYNGILVLSEAGVGWYYKRHLVPFGEYFPVPAFVRSWMRLMSLPNDDFTPGAARQPQLRAAGQDLGLTICFEDAFGSEQLRVLRNATLLINVTNNALVRRFHRAAPASADRADARARGRTLSCARRERRHHRGHRSAGRNRGAPAAISRGGAARRGTADDRPHSRMRGSAIIP